MKRLTPVITIPIFLAVLAGCSGSDGGGGEGDIIAGSSSSSSSSSTSSGSGITNTGLPVHETFGTYTAFDRDDTIDFFSDNYKALATDVPDDPWPSFYYPTCCFFEDNDPSGQITVDYENRLGITSDNGNPSLLVSDARFSIGQTRSSLADPGETDPKRDATPGSAGAGESWGELDLTEDYRISFCVKDAAGAGSNTQIYVDNSTTSEASSIHGGGSVGSRIFNVPTSDLIPGRRVEINIPGETTLEPGGPSVTTKTTRVGTESSFLQFRVSSGGHAIIDDLLIETQSDAGNTPVPACNVFTPATPPNAPDAPNLVAGDEQITVVWSSVVSAAAYDVAYNTVDDTAGATVVADVEDTNTTLTGLTNGTDYFVFVRARNSAGSSDYSPSSSATPTEPSGCAATTMVSPSPANNILWNVYDGCLAPDTPGAVIANGSDSTQFDFSGSSDPALFTANGDGTATLDTTTLGDDRSYGDFDDIVNDAGTYPKTFTFIARINTPLDAHRGFEVESGFADAGETGSRVKMILRPDQGTDGRVQLERISGGTSSDDTSESEQAMSDGYHIYHIAYTLSDARTISAVVYRDGVDISSSFDLDITGVTPRDGTDNHIRIGENASHTYFGNIDWMVWTDDSTAAGLTPGDLEGELPEGIGELGPYSGEVWTAEAVDLVGSGGSAPSGSLVVDEENAVTITAAGGSVNSGSVRKFFAYQEITGDFTFTARLTSATTTGGGAFSTTSNGNRFGIAIMESLTPPGSGQFVDAGRFATVDYYLTDTTPTFQGARAHKLDIGDGVSSNRSRSDAALNIGDYLRIQVEDEAGTPRVRRFSSADGISYTQLNSTQFEDGNGNGYPSSWFVGVYGAPGDDLTLVFEDVEITQP